MTITLTTLEQFSREIIDDTGAFLEKARSEFYQLVFEIEADKPLEIPPVEDIVDSFEDTPHIAIYSIRMCGDSTFLHVIVPQDAWRQATKVVRGKLLNLMEAKFAEVA